MLRLQAAIAANQPSVPNLPLFASVNSDLNTALAKIPAPPADVDAAYRTFMTLEILWERRGDSDILHACGEAGNDLTKLFEIVDRRDWQDLKAANVVIQLPRNSAPAGLEAFAPLEFSVTAGGVPVESSYLFRHNFSQNQFGGTIGGPIIKNRTFFFFDAQDFTSRKATTVNATSSLREQPEPAHPWHQVRESSA